MTSGLLTAADPSQWVADELVTECHLCGDEFGFFSGKHHCRRCGLVFCEDCSDRSLALASPAVHGLVTHERVCQTCFAGAHANQEARGPAAAASAREQLPVERNRHWETPLLGQPRPAVDGEGATAAGRALVKKAQRRRREKFKGGAEGGQGETRGTLAIEDDAENWPVGAEFATVTVRGSQEGAAKMPEPAVGEARRPREAGPRSRRQRTRGKTARAAGHRPSKKGMLESYIAGSDGESSEHSSSSELEPEPEPEPEPRPQPRGGGFRNGVAVSAETLHHLDTLASRTEAKLRRRVATYVAAPTRPPPPPPPDWTPEEEQKAGGPRGLGKGRAPGGAPPPPPPPPAWSPEAETRARAAAGVEGVSTVLGGALTSGLAAEAAGADVVSEPAAADPVAGEGGGTGAAERQLQAIRARKAAAVAAEDFEAAAEAKRLEAALLAVLPALAWQEQDAARSVPRSLSRRGSVLCLPSRAAAVCWIRAPHDICGCRCGCGWR
jgi:hypothetical protein